MDLFRKEAMAFNGMYVLETAPRGWLRYRRNRTILSASSFGYFMLVVYKSFLL